MAQQDVAFERLHALAGRGYVAELSERAPAGGGILLRHPKEGPALILRPDGALEAAEASLIEAGRADRLTIPPSDQRGFSNFVARLRPSRKRSRMRKIFYVLVGLVLWFVSLMLTVALLSG